jgi:hypothetical protein
MAVQAGFGRVRTSPDLSLGVLERTLGCCTMGRYLRSLCPQFVLVLVPRQSIPRPCVGDSRLRWPGWPDIGFLLRARLGSLHTRIETVSRHHGDCRSVAEGGHRPQWLDTLVMTAMTIFRQSSQVRSSSTCNADGSESETGIRGFIGRTRRPSEFLRRHSIASPSMSVIGDFSTVIAKAAA